MSLIQFVNNLGEPLEQGDVIVIGSKKPLRPQGMGNNFLVLEADVTDRAYDTRVCGIVCEVYTELKLEGDEEPEPTAETKKAAKAKPTAKAGEAEAARPQAVTLEEYENLDRTKVAPGQLGVLIAHGVYGFCKVDADIASVEVGDLLTTSPTKGHAQKVLESGKATGAIIGKALGALKKGKGKIPVIVALQ